jgi:membrane protein implicated in regulation of membrane protease activity
VVLLVFGGLAIAAGWVMRAKGLPVHWVLFPGGGLMLALGAYKVLRRPAPSR